MSTPQSQTQHDGTLSEQQETIRSVAAVFLILGLLTLFILEMVVGAPVTTTMLSVIVGLILVLFGIDDAHWILFRGGVSTPRGEPLHDVPGYPGPPAHTYRQADEPPEDNAMSYEEIHDRYDSGRELSSQRDYEEQRARDHEREREREREQEQEQEQEQERQARERDEYDAEADGGRRQ